MKDSIGKFIPKDTCLSLFQGLGRILYKKGFNMMQTCFYLEN